MLSVCKVNVLLNFTGNVLAVGERAGCYTDDEENLGKEPSQVLSVQASSGCPLQELSMTKEASGSRPLQELSMTKEASSSHPLQELSMTKEAIRGHPLQVCPVLCNGQCIDKLNVWFLFGGQSLALKKPGSMSICGVV